MARIGFIGCGPGGRRRMAQMLDGGEIEAAAICDPDLDCVGEALKLAPDAVLVPDVEEMLQLGLDGIVIASPAAHHGAQATAALKAGVAVFCRPPLAGTAAETIAAVEAANATDSLLGVDLSYRFTEGMQRLREYVQGGEIAQPFAADMVFHLAAGPGPQWPLDAGPSGGGCAIDLGAPLIDLALWTMGFPKVEALVASLFAGGEPAEPGTEDYAAATLRLAGGAMVRISCGWNMSIGREAAIEANFQGSGGAASFRNVGGSLTDFRAEIHHGTRVETLSSPGEPWAGRAATRWAARVESGEGFDAEAERLIAVAQVIDRMYGR